MIRPPTHEEVRVSVKFDDESLGLTEKQLQLIKEFIEIESWICPNCQSVLHGWVRVCPYNRPGFKCGYVRP